MASHYVSYVADLTANDSAIIIRWKCFPFVLWGKQPVWIKVTKKLFFCSVYGVRMVFLSVQSLDWEKKDFKNPKEIAEEQFTSFKKIDKTLQLLSFQFKRAGLIIIQHSKICASEK